MYCEPCRVERLGTARFCVICGGQLHARSKEELEADLAHVRWLLSELTEWDQATVAQRARQYVVDRYREREKVLTSALNESPRSAAPAPAPAPVPAAAVKSPETTGLARAQVEAVAQAAEELAARAHPKFWDEDAESRASGVPPPPPAAEPRPPGAAAKPLGAAPAVLLDLEREALSTDDRVVAAASTWSRIWKPFLSESIFWFVGAFLILSGLFYLVADSWSGMTTTFRALVVFGLASGWTLGFSAWAQFLWRREATRSAARVLKLIGAAMAPLAPIAVGPVVLEHPLLTSGLVLLWATVAAALALTVTRDVQGKSLRFVPAAMFACATMMGLAPLVGWLHHAVGAQNLGAWVWLMAIPLGLLWANSRSEARTQGATARLFAFLAPLYLAVLYGASLQYTLRGEGIAWGTWAPFLALAFTAALELRAPVGKDGRPRWEYAADPISILVVAGQLGLMAWAALGAAPAFFVTSAVGAHTTWRMLKGSTSPLAPRWIYGLYGFGYFAWQSCGQLVPGVIKQLVAQLKEGLGYQASGSLPPSYDAPYAVVFVLAGALLAARWLKGDATRRGWAEPLLRCTWVTSILVAGLALASLGADVRPALLTLPFVVALCLAMGLRLDRPEFTRTGSGLTLGLAVTLIAWLHLPASALPIAAIALALALKSVPMVKAHREPLSLASGALVAIAVALSWTSPGHAGQVVALGVAFAAAWLVARNLDVGWLQQVAWMLPAVGVARAMVLWAPEYAPLALAATALGLAVLARSTGRMGRAELASAIAALVAPVWQWVLQDHGGRILLGPVLVICAAALAAGARRTEKNSTAGWRDAVALCFAALSLLPGKGQYQMWIGWRPIDAVSAYAVLGLVASVWAARLGRRWRAALLASLSIAGTLWAWGVWEWFSSSSSEPATLALIGAIGALLTIRALLPSISVPIAALFAVRAFAGNPAMLLGLAVAVSVLALFEEWDFTWAHVLGKRGVSWAASLSALGVLGAMFIDSSAHWHWQDEPRLWIVASVLPLLWVRATRSAVLAFTLAPLVLLAAGPTHRESAWVVAGTLIALTHLVAWVKPLRALIFGKEEVTRVQLWFGPWALAGAAVLGTTLVIDGWAALPWALLMLLAASELLALRLAFAAAFAVATPGLAPIGATVLIALCLLERLIPGLVSRALGSKPHPSTVFSGVVAAIGLAGFAAATAPHAQAAPAAWLLGAIVAAGAVLLNQRWMLSGAVLAAALPQVVETRSLYIHGLVPNSAWIAFAGAALASVLRKESWQEKVRASCARLNSPVGGDLASPLWVGSALAVTALLTLGGREPELALAVPLLATGALLFATPDRIQVGFAAALAALLVFVVVPLPVGAAILGGVGFVLCLGGMLLEKRHPVGLAWHHAGWALSLLALGGANSLHHPATAIAWGFASACAVVVAHRNPAVEFVRWVGLAAGAHVGLFYLGLVFSHGAPRELILPWIASASLLVGAAALVIAKSGRTGQRLGSGWGLMMLGASELLIGLVLLPGGELREACVASAGLVVALWALSRRVASDDDAISATVAGLLIPLGFMAVRRLAFLAEPNVVESLAALVAGAGAGGLARLLEDSGLPKSARVGRAYAFAWPLLGLLAAPWSTPWTVCLLMLAQSAHFAVVARDAAVRRRAAILSTIAFNGAMAAGFFATGAHSAEYLLIPFGISLLTLIKIFEGDVQDSTRVKLRAVAVSLVYGAAAAKPLTFDVPWALWLCVGLCVVGIALGVVLKIRSYVYMGTAFLVTTVVANLIRYGVREPRIGALFLSGLGLAVVGFMVLVTTRRNELLSKYKHAREMLQNWDG